MPERPPLPRSSRLALALGLGLALLLIPRHGLWVDEAFSLALAGGHSLEQPAGTAESLDWKDGAAMGAASWGRLLDPRGGSLQAVPAALRRSDTSPPLYYVVLNLWSRCAGASDAALRGLSLLAWLGAWLLLARVAWARLGPGRWGPGLAFFALAPAALWFGTEGRMYALGWLALAAAAHGAERAAAKGWRGAWPWAFALAGAGAAWTHYFYLPAFLGLALGWALLGGGRRALAWAALAPLSLLPWLLSGAAQAERWRVSAGWLDGRPGPLALLLSPLRLAWQLWRGQGLWSSPSAPLWTAGAALSALALLLITAGLLRAWRAAYAPLALWAAAGLCTPALFDLWQGTHSSAVPRYALAALPALALLASAGFAAWPGRLRAALLLCLFSGWGLEARTPWSQAGRLDNPLRAAAQALRALPQGSGVIVQSIPSGALGLSRYLPPTTPVLALNGRLSPAPGAVIDAFAAGRPLLALCITHELDHGTPALTHLSAHARLLAEDRVDSIRWLYFAPASGNRSFPSQRSTRREGK